jgi:hypothetical protein
LSDRLPMAHTSLDCYSCTLLRWTCASFLSAFEVFKCVVVAVVVDVEGRIVPAVPVLKGPMAPLTFGATHVPNDLVSVRANFPLEVCMTTPSTRILYLPLP